MNLLRNAMVKYAMTLGDKVAVVDGEERVTYRELNNEVNRLANALYDMGLRKGDKISILFYNSLHYIEAFLAIHKIGLVYVPNNFRYVARELQYQVDHSDSVTLIYGGEFNELVSSIKGSLPKVKYFICADGSQCPPGILDYEELKSRYSAEEPPEVIVGPDDLQSILYTSGTTGLPKGVTHTYHAGIFIGANEVAFDCKLTTEDVFLGSPPFYHIAGHCFCLATPIALGARIVVMKSFNPEEALRLIQDEKITYMFVVPTMGAAILRLGEKISQYDTGSLRVWFSTAAILNEVTKNRMKYYFPHVNVYDNYGSTETLNITRLDPMDFSRKAACQGLPVLTQQVTLLDDFGKKTPSGEVGEVCVKGVAVTCGYYKNPAETEKANAAGWFHTGDLARLDGEGYLYIVDRKKDMIISGGVNIYPVEIEAQLCQYEKVQEVAVIGVPDVYWGEAACAVIVPTPGQECTKEEIMSFSAQRLAGYKKPKHIVFLDSLPKNPSGKVLKRELRKQIKIAEEHSGDGGRKS